MKTQKINQLIEHVKIKLHQKLHTIFLQKNTFFVVLMSNLGCLSQRKTSMKTWTCQFSTFLLFLAAFRPKKAKKYTLYYNKKTNLGKDHFKRGSIQLVLQ